MKSGVHLAKRRTETVERNTSKTSDRLGDLIYDGMTDKSYDIKIKGKVKKF